MESNDGPIALTLDEIFTRPVRNLLAQAARHIKNDPKEMENGFKLAMAFRKKSHGHYNTTIVLALSMLLKEMLNEALIEEDDTPTPPADPVS